MTIIAASKAERVMLADTLVTDEKVNSRLCHVVKIVRCKDGALAGAAGDSGIGGEFLKWAINGRRGNAPVAEKGEDMDGLVLTPAGEILVYYGSLPERVLDSVMFIGAGADCAKSAHLAGASLERAVQIAIEVSPKCGGTITKLKLGPQRKRQR